LFPCHYPPPSPHHHHVCLSVCLSVYLPSAS
jgi:hypothetical protein